MDRQTSVLTLQQVADELDLHYMTVYRYVRLGLLPAHKEGGSWRVKRSDLEELREAPAPAVGRGKKSTPWDERLTQRLLATDTSGAWSVVEAAESSGMTVGDVYARMIIPALQEVGTAWHEGRISIAQEHAASQIATRLVSRLSAKTSRRGVSKGVVVLGTTAIELHTLPVMIAAELIRLAGYDVLDLGSRLPAASFAEIVAEQQRLVAVGISVTSRGQADEIKETIEAIRSRSDVPVLLGGGAIDGDEHAKLLGADAGAQRVEDILPHLGDLV